MAGEAINEGIRRVSDATIKRQMPEIIRWARKWQRYAGEGAYAFHVVLDLAITVATAVDGALIAISKKYSKGARQADDGGLPEDDPDPREE